MLPLLGGLRVSGQENIPTEGPVLFAPNHVSFIDPPVMGCAAWPRVRFMAKEELFRFKPFGKLIGSLGAFPVRRGENDSAAIRVAIDVLKGGDALLVFPEGTRGDGERLLPIRAGIAMLAKRSGAVVVPVGIAGTARVLPKGAKLPRPTRMRVHFGRAFTYADLATAESERDNRERFAAELALRIAEAAAQAGYPVLPAIEAETHPSTTT